MPNARNDTKDGKQEQDFLESIANSGERFQLGMGQVLLGENSKREYVYFLLSGRLRQLTRDPYNRERIFTIAVHEPAFAGGWASIQSGKNIETLSAAEDSEIIRIEASLWYQALDKSPRENDIYTNGVTISDLWPLVVANQNLHLPSTQKDIRSWIKRLSEEAITKWIEPGAPSSNPLDERFHWIVAAENNSKFYYGASISSEDLASIQGEIENRLRLVGIPEEVWLRYPHFPAEPSSRQRYRGLTAPGEKNEEAEEAAKEAKDESEHDELDPSGYRFFDSKPGEVPETVACFKTICHELNVPLKVEPLEKVLEQQTKKSDT